VHQAQAADLFDIILEMVFETGDRKNVHKFRVSDKTHLFRIPMSQKPLSIKVDPDGWVLKTVSVEQY
jgi:hypothetical protein